MLASVDPLPDQNFALAGKLTDAFQSRNCGTLRAAASLVWRMPYGRTRDRADYRLVLVEGHGTCSTKHALLAALALEQDIPLDLWLGIYEMTESNTPGTGALLDRAGLRAMPEAHCWLRYRGADIDLTMPPGPSQGMPERKFLHQESIRPDQIGAYKTHSHRVFLAKWLAEQKRADISLDCAWRIREACIAQLSVRPSHV